MKMTRQTDKDIKQVASRLNKARNASPRKPYACKHEYILTDRCHHCGELKDSTKA